MIIIRSLHELGFYFESISPSGRGSSWSRLFKVILGPKVNCAVNWGLWGGEMSWDTSIMFKWGLFIILNIHLEDSKVMAKVTKNGKWPIIQSFQIWQVFGPLSTWLVNVKEVSNGFLVNMEVVDLCTPFPKSLNSCPCDEWLRSYGHFITRCAWKFKMA